MGRRLMVVWAGRRRRDEWETLCGRYEERIRRFRPIEDVVVKPCREGPDAVRQATDGKALLSALPDPCWTIALDRRARTKSSRALSEHLIDLEERWPHPIAFLIGSDLGIDETTLRACRERLSFGALTLPHELARLVLYEQLYRALSIAAGIKYHREPL